MAEKTSVLSSNPADVIKIFWISDLGMDSDVDIGTLPISEWQFSLRHIFFRYWNNRCRVGCRISPILRSMSMPTYANRGLMCKHYTVHSDLNNFTGKWTPLVKYTSTETGRIRQIRHKNKQRRPSDFRSWKTHVIPGFFYLLFCGWGFDDAWGLSSYSKTCLYMKNNFATIGTVHWED